MGKAGRLRVEIQGLSAPAERLPWARWARPWFNSIRHLPKTPPRLHLRAVLCSSRLRYHREGAFTSSDYVSA